MRYTLGQAVKRLQATSHAYGITDVKDAINHAIESLSGLSGWECLRQVLRFSSVGPCITLPQGSAALVRVCVNGHPSTLRGQDFRFIHSGPGDLSAIPPGFSRVLTKNVIDLGESPVMSIPARPFRLYACSDGTDAAPAVTVTGVTVDGRLKTIILPVIPAPVYSGTTLISGQKPEDVAPNSTIFQTITEVTLSDSAADYLTLYTEDVDSYDRVPIAVYHPAVHAPYFRRYSISGIGKDQPVDILAEVRIDPLPLVKNTDPLPFDGIDPVEWMIRADWSMKANEVDTAKKYIDQAMQWMKAKEVTDDRIQTAVIVNSVFDGSMGEISGEAFNI